MKLNKLKILAVDDIQDNLTTLKAVVEDAVPDAIFKSALSGVKGIEMALKEDPDVILLDIVMPGMDGFEVCRRLKADERVRHIPVVFLTALQTDRASRIMALEVGGEAFLSKPLEEAELIAQIRAMAKIKAAAVVQRRENERLGELVKERTRALRDELAARKRTEEDLKEKVAALKTLNQNLEEAQNQLLQSVKMAAVGQLAAGITHEINNPISFVRSNFNSLTQYVNSLLDIDAAYGEIEKQYADKNPEIFRQVHELKNDAEHSFIVSDLRQLISESRDGLERVNAIVQDLNNFSRIGDASWEWADLHSSLDAVLKIVLNDFKYNVRIERQFGELPKVHCVSAQISQVLMNVLLNAAQSIEDQGVIIIRTGCEDNQVWIEVQDDGNGIDPKNMKRIFEPFFTTKPAGKGTGLGLSIAWGIVQRHKGKIEVSSEKGGGTVSRIVLPVDPETIS